MADRIQFRRDTAARWSQFNPVLMEGEIGVVTDNPNQYKIGNGSSAWNSLPFRGFDGTVTQEPGNAEDAVMSQKAVTSIITEYNVSMKFPTEGIDGTNKYTLETAIAKIPATIFLTVAGFKCSFLNKNNELETWEYLGGGYNNINRWGQIGTRHFEELDKRTGGKYGRFLVNAQITNWTGGDKILYIDLIYRNYSAMAGNSGVRIMSSDADGGNESQVAYWSGLTGERTGVETLDRLTLSGGLGEIAITINWDIIETNSNNVLGDDDIIIIPKQYFAIPISVQYLNKRFPTFTKNILGESFIKEIYTSSGDKSESYKIAVISRNHTEYKYRIDITKNDGTNVARLISTDLEESTNSVIYIAPYSNSGISFYIVVDWSAIENGTSKSYAIDLQSAMYDLGNSPLIADYLQKNDIDAEFSNLENELSGKISAGQKDEEIIPIEGNVEETFPFRVWYNQPIIGVTYRNKTEKTVSFNSIKTLLFDSNSGATLRVYKVDASAYNNIIRYSVTSFDDDRLTLVYEGLANNTTQGVYETVNLGNTVSLAQNESLFVVLFSTQTTSRSASAPLGPVNEEYSGGYPIVYCLGSDLERIYFGYLSYDCVPPILIAKTGFVPESELENDVKEIIEQVESEKLINSVELYIPKNIYTTENLEMNLWNDALIRGTDRGLQSPANWYLEPQLTGAVLKERSLCINRGIQSNQLTVKVYDVYGNYVKSFISTVNTISKSASGLSANVLWLGDSLESDAQISTNVRNLLDENDGSNVIFVGSKGSGINKHEAYGGYRFRNYATEGWMIARFYVTGNEDETFNIGDVYTITSTLSFTITEINITSGNGYVSGSLGNNVSIDESFPQSGVLSRKSGTGSATLTYTSWTQESSNPLWNNDTNKIDIPAYRTKIGLSSSKIDVVIFILGVNGSLGSLQTEEQVFENQIQYAIELYNQFVLDNPNCKFIFNLPTTCGNTKGGWGANYGGVNDIINYQKNIFTLRKLMLQYFDENETYPNAYVNIGGITVDRYYGYALQDKAISNVVEETEKVHVNAVHPTTSGYKEYGNANYAMLINVIKTAIQKTLSKIL